MLTTLRRETSSKPLRLRGSLRYPIFLIILLGGRSNSARTGITTVTLLRSRKRRSCTTRAVSPSRAQGIVNSPQAADRSDVVASSDVREDGIPKVVGWVYRVVGSREAYQGGT